MGEQSEKDAAAPARGKINWLIWPVAIIGLIGAGLYGYQRYQFDDTHIVTDNAQVQGQIVKILAPERGWLDTLSVLENQPVTQGETLAKLKNNYYQLEVDRAQAKLNALQGQAGAKTKEADGGSLAQAKLATARANLEVIQAQLSQAQSAADQANDKFNQLQNSRTSPTFVQSQLDMAQATADQSNASLLTLQKEAYAAQQQVQEAMANAQLLDYNIEEARAELAQAKMNLESTEIRSPISGKIAQLKIDPGTMVEQGQYLMSVVSSDDKWLVANIKETLFEQVFIGDLVDITIDAFPGTDFKGVVESLSPAAGNQFSIIPRNYASGNFIKVEALIPVMIRFTEPELEIQKLVPGMSAEVQISVDPIRKKQHAQSSSNPASAPSVPGTTPTASAPDSSKTSTDAKPATAGDATEPQPAPAEAKPANGE